MKGNNAGGDILIIDQVDLDMLDEQRKVLARLRRRLCLTLTKDEEEALDGVTNMLDVWSDERARCQGST